MLLSARMMSHVAHVNEFDVVESYTFTQGDSTYVYFQLVDSSVDSDLTPPYRRYIPVLGATVSVKFQSVDSAKTIERAAEMAFPNDDRSIWRVIILPTDSIVGTRDMKLVLTEDGTKTYGYVRQAVSIKSQDMSF